MKVNIPGISIEEYNYHLPDHRIARYPQEVRDESKLLLYKNGQISQDVFYKIGDHLPADSVLIFNDTRVIRARLFFYKETGARIELFCLEPAAHEGDYQLAFTKKASVSWRCIVGNSKKWKSGILKHKISHQGKDIILYASREENLGNESIVKLWWEPSHYTFSDILEASGEIPLPPYLKRNAEKADHERYQTVYARNKGSVAAPTAGLHFTPRVFEALKEKNILLDYVTLHVSAGTFKPVSSQHIEGHEMHNEQIVIDRDLLNRLSGYIDKKLIAVGTTSIRTLESIYWFGTRLWNGAGQDAFHVAQWDPYKNWNKLPAAQQALQLVRDYMDRKNMEILTGETGLMIAPGYDFKLVDGMITNFHLPKSTLLLLIAAYLGEDWKKAYEYALENDFRFLSYGDSCLFYHEG